MKITQDGHNYSVFFAGTSNGTIVEVMDNEDTLVGTVNINDDMEQISYDKEDGESGSLNYWEFAANDEYYIDVAKWIVGTSY